MRKIAMLTCLNANRVCTGAACLKAFYERIRGFSQYAGQDIQLAAFMKCNGCDSDPEQDTGMYEKVERLKQEQVEIVHVGICARNKDGSRCPSIEKIVKMIEQQGIDVVNGTHDT